MGDVAANLRKVGVNVVAPVEEYLFVSGCPSESYDFLISDADHLNSGTWIDEHLRIVRPGGFLFFHDTNQIDEFPNMALIGKRVKELGLCHYHFKKSSRPDEQCERGWLFVMKPEREALVEARSRRAREPNGRCLVCVGARQHRRRGDFPRFPSR